ncbi:MAG: hypothetical protein IJM81_07935 [Prevotella sp.]|nr:hypothetical protein [Prevotella sp.]
MKQFSMILALLPVALAFPLTAGAINYVNEDAPGVHKEWDKKLKKEVWKTGMGSYLCDVKDSKPLHAIDEDYFAENITQEGKDLMGVHKEWDKKRGCFVWKDGMGNFLGRDKPDGSSDKSWLKKKEPNWLSSTSFPFLTTTGNKTLAEILKQSDKELDEKTAAEMKKNKRAGIPGDEEINRKLREGDMNVDEAQKQIEAARAALREAGMEGQYEGLLREAEAGIRDYKNKRRK